MLLTARPALGSHRSHGGVTDSTQSPGLLAGCRIRLVPIGLMAVAVVTVRDACRAAGVAAYIPDAGESPADLTYKFPGSELQGSNLLTRAEPDGTDIYLFSAFSARVSAFP